MAVIPPDAGLSLRLQTETNLQPIAPVKPVGIELPGLQTGQMFSARILEVLPENTYRALVAGKEITLALPQGAAGGDTLELVVIDRTPKTIIAQYADRSLASDAAAAGSPGATLSAAARLITSLMPAQGEAPTPAPLGRGEPLLPQPPASPAELANQLGKAVAQSGLFYESHQAQWVAGRLPLQQLLQEPQGQTSPMPPQPDAAAHSWTAARDQAAAARAGADTAARSANPAAPSPTSGASDGRGGAGTSATPAAAAQAASTAAQHAENAATAQPIIPDALRPLVQQQLDAVATQRLAWHGEIWPGQTMDWAVRRDDSSPSGRQQDDAPAERWTSSLRLTVPRLGDIQATLQISGGAVRIDLATPSEASAADLRAGIPALAASLADAGVPLLAMQVKREEA